MRIDVLTLFPGMFEGPLTESILLRARESGLLDIRLHQLRDFSPDRKHRTADDAPYGGGAGMVMRADVLVPAIERITGEGGFRVMPSSPERGEGHIEASSAKGAVPASPADSSIRPRFARATRSDTNVASPCRIFLSPAGKRLTQAKVERLAREPWLLLLAGHYEGIDHRVIEGGWIDEELSIGDYVLTGGELPAMVLIDALARQIPGVLGKEESAEEESFSPSLGRKREYPHYTRPEEFRGLRVPDILLSGHHAEIDRWRKRHLR